MGVSSLSFARIDKITTDFIFSILPKAIRFLILFLGFVTIWCRRVSAHYNYVSMIDKKSFKFVYKRSENYLKQEYHSSRCTICLTEISDGEVARKLQCNHTFHRSCLDRWLIRCNAANCPLCRATVLHEEEVAEYQLVQNDISFEKELAIFLLPTLRGGSCSNLYTLPSPTINSF